MPGSDVECELRSEVRVEDGDPSLKVSINAPSDVLRKDSKLMFKGGSKNAPSVGTRGELQLPNACLNNAPGIVRKY